MPWFSSKRKSPAAKGAAAPASFRYVLAVCRWRSSASCGRSLVSPLRCRHLVKLIYDLVIILIYLSSTPVVSVHNFSKVLDPAGEG